ncbi:hypothetical protein QNN03_20800 [Streptomyces sp. GXMU-J15]|uniref:Serine/threonine protein kinase n=1 Tax=Streptomyces fuscus TaxID=3048495 RepID=A0ABT7J1Y9_9ACTN|nr:hypothetical protein [Streptomyces fuscus]MDL2078877.1 hypothetical protein [Streptomyces fuscus]
MEVPEEEESAAPRRRRRGRRTALLLTGAGVLGLVAGTCAGYLVQAEREPTPLPPLSQPELKRAAGEAPEPLPVSRDRQVRTEGDLRKLVLRKPAGAQKAGWLTEPVEWLDMADYANMYDDPSRAYANMAPDFRRAVTTGWETDTYTVEINLVQHRQDETLAAKKAVENHQYWATFDGSDPESDFSENKDVKSWTIPGTEEGMAYVDTVPDTEPGYEPLYRASAHAWRGDINMEIWIYGSEPIARKTILDIAERQMERL